MCGDERDLVELREDVAGIGGYVENPKEVSAVLFDAGKGIVGDPRTFGEMMPRDPVQRHAGIRLERIDCADDVGRIGFFPGHPNCLRCRHGGKGNRTCGLRKGVKSSSRHAERRMTL